MIYAVLFTTALALGAQGTDWCQDVEAPMRSATAAIAAKKYDEADRILAQLESKHPLCWEVQLGLGRVRYELGDYRGAGVASELALLWAPENFKALVLRGQILGNQGEFAQAQQLLEKACKLEPKNAEAYFQLGVLRDGNQRHREAVDAFQRALALRPRDARAHDYLALNLEPLGKLAEAEAVYRQGLAVNSGDRADPFLDYNYGRLLFKLNRLQESRKHFDLALQAAPPTRAVYYERARLNLRMENLTEARADAEKALLPDQDGYIIDLQVYNLLVQIYGRLGEEQLAARYVELCKTATVPMQGRERK
jgi:tetratricopeptide (TPR) repeat protein